jgi:hypothetical protein
LVIAFGFALSIFAAFIHLEFPIGTIGLILMVVGFILYVNDLKKKNQILTF